MRQGPSQHRPAPAWTRPITERLSPLIKTVVIAEALVFVFYVMVKAWRPFLLDHVAMGSGFLAGEIWQPVTALLLHTDVLNFVFSMLGLWFVGAAVERLIGPRRLVEILVIPGVLANLATALAGVAFNHPVMSAGIGDGVLALFVVMGRQYDRAPVSLLGGLTLEARRAAAILVGFSLVVTLAQGGFAQAVGILVASGAGYLLGGSSSLLGAIDRWRLKRIRRRLGVIEGGRSRSDRPSYLN